MCNPTVDQTHVTHCLNNVARARLALRANHGCAFRNAAQRLAQVARTADKRHVKRVFINVIRIVGGSQHLGFVNIVNLNGLQNLSLHGVTDAHLSHNGNAHRLLNALDHLRIAHARNAARSANVSGNALQSHNGARAGSFGDTCLLRRGNVHNHAALEHLGKLTVQRFPVRFCFGSYFVCNFSHVDSPIPTRIVGF